MPEKQYLMTPGPTPVPPQVAAALSQPMIHHRAPEFRRLLTRLLADLKEVFRTRNDVLLYAGSGTACMDGAVANLCSPGDRVLVVCAGNFGERWLTIARAYGCDVHALEYEWGEVPSADDVGAKLDELGGAHAVFLTHSETSTGVVADVEELAARIRPSGALVVVDAISSLGAVPLELDAWGIDVAVSGSQKALMCPPGLGLVSASERACEAAARSTSPRFYLDWERTRQSQAETPASTPFTPAIPIVRGLSVAVELLLAEGLEAAFDRHRRLGRAARAGVKAMGLELFSPDDDSAAVVTAIRMPDGVDAGAVIRRLSERFGITMEGGRKALRGKIVRIGHIGYVDVFDVTTSLAALELALSAEGAEVERGASVTAALEAYGEPAGLRA
ncbi:MAG TPA: alanine--glyoxylate aminotransferase family protein [Gaiellaceae bacterium]|nr:alanine--glyoxylate aminotransferase family protein [Gaiellaceae bacterium]